MRLLASLLVIVIFSTVSACSASAPSLGKIRYEVTVSFAFRGQEYVRNVVWESEFFEQLGQPGRKPHAAEFVRGEALAVDVAGGRLFLLKRANDYISSPGFGAASIRCLQNDAEDNCFREGAIPMPVLFEFDGRVTRLQYGANDGLILRFISFHLVDPDTPLTDTILASNPWVRELSPQGGAAQYELYSSTDFTSLHVESPY